MMCRTERYHPFVAGFRAQGPELGKSNVVRLARLPTANEAGLVGNKLEVVLVTDAPRRCDRQQCFVDSVVGVIAAFWLPSAIATV